MKKVLRTILILLLLAALWTGNTIAVYADSDVSASIDPGKTSSLTLQYRHNGAYFEGLEIKTYHVGDVSAAGIYSLTNAFQYSSVNLNYVKTQAEWKTIASTLAAFAAAESLNPDCSAVTEGNGTVSFRNLKPGMYLTLAVSHKGDTEITSFETFLTAVPYPDGSGTYQYDVTAFPKCSSRPVVSDKVEYKVIKLWKDTGFSQNRPERIRVRIMKDGKVQEIQTLSGDNNWSYSWTAEDDGSIWQVSEIAISFGYSVTITESGSTFILTNTHEELQEPEEPDSPDPPDTPDPPDVPDIPDNPNPPDVPDLPEAPDVPDEPDSTDTPDEPDQPDNPNKPDTPQKPDKTDKSEKTGKTDTPKTGDMTVIWPYALAMCLSGALLLILAVWRMRSE